MKSRIILIMLFVVVRCYSQSVPDTRSFSLRDVTNVVGGTSLRGSISNSVDGCFDPLYKGDKDRLYSFRNYHTTKPLNCSDNIQYSGGYSPDPRVYTINFGDSEGLFIIAYQNYTIADKIELFQGSTLVATTGGKVSGGSVKTNDPDIINKAPLRFVYNPNNGKIGTVRVTTTSTDTQWYIGLVCPRIKLLGETETILNQNYSLYYKNLTSGLYYIEVIGLNNEKQVIVSDGSNLSNVIVNMTVTGSPATVAFYCNYSSVVVDVIETGSNIATKYVKMTKQ